MIGLMYEGETQKLCGPAMRINLVEGETQKLSINSEFFSAKSRPTGVKAEKSRGKKTMEEGKGLAEFERMWSIKQEDLTRKERLSQLSLLDRLLAKTEPLAEYEEALKKNLINELFST
ncbi:hypothetical protein DY000_02046156 [Brassica cretica]|uniref:Uncharacterized protein n=1 Tax=Brassica cretica TaxID=69181 RepID=A0ABQ7EWE9_BRACR|nr:hypothetical protein DY000_02046156 [Brassica cretica]